MNSFDVWRAAIEVGGGAGYGAPTMSVAVGDIRNACVDLLAATLQVAKHKIDTRAAFDRLGLDSVMAVSLLVDLERQFDVELSPDAVFEYQTVDALSAYILAVRAGDISA